MGRLSKAEDAYGQAMFDYYQHGRGFEIVERDDGMFAVSCGPPEYFAEYKNWAKHQKTGIRLAKGRVLDIGCGAGRVGLHLQGNGLDVTGVDVSPLAVKVCKLRGLKDARVMSITQLDVNMGMYDTIVMYGNNFGLMGGFKRARWLLKRFHKMTSPDARIIAETRDPYIGELLPCHLEYHERNRRRGRMAGQLRFRIRYLQHATPFFDYLLVSRDELREILNGTGWQINRLIDSENSNHYVAVIEKADNPVGD